MNEKTKGVLAWGINAAVVIAGIGFVAACGGPTDAEPAVCATYWSPNTANGTAGQWLEEDGEPLDADPCDTDDDSTHKKPSKPKPKPKSKTTRK